MKKQLIATMAMVMGIAGGMSFPVQAAGNSRGNNRSQLKGCVIVNGQLCDLSDVKNSLEDWCQQIQIGSGNNCSVILLPGCNQPGKPENNQPESEKPNVPDSNQPEQDNSGNDAPEVEQPGQGNEGDNIPEVEQPELPESELPEQDVPENNDPEIEIPALPENNQPEQDNSGNNTPEIEQPETDTESLSYAEQVVALVNEERAKIGLSPVELDTEIASAALVRTKEIKTSFSHTRPDGRKFSTVLTDNGIRFRGAGENIAWGQRSPEQVMNAWMNSSGHRANILNAKYTKLGVGHFQDASGTNYWVQLFTY